MLGNLSYQFDAVDVGHPEIGDDEIKTRFFELKHRLLPIGGTDYLMSRILQQTPDQCGVGRAIFG